MSNLRYKIEPFVKLNCGCLISEESGELHEQCTSHGQAFFMQ